MLLLIVVLALASPDVLTGLGFDREERARISAGDVVGRKLTPSSDKELAAAVAIVIPRPLDVVFAEFESGRTLDRDEGAKNWSVLPASELTVRDLSMIRFDQDEVETLLEVGAGDELNLSAAELDRFESLRERAPRRRPERLPTVQNAVARTYRQVVHERVQAYRRDGLDGIAPYQRDDDKRTRAAAELRKAGAQPCVTKSLEPELCTAFMGDSETLPDGAKDRLLLIEYEIDERPAYILSHRVAIRRDAHAVMLERHFFVGHTYNALHAAVIVMPVEGGTLVVQVNRTSVDRVAGFAKGLRHGVGSGRLIDTLSAHLEEVRRALVATDGEE